MPDIPGNTFDSLQATPSVDMHAKQIMHARLTIALDADGGWRFSTNTKILLTGTDISEAVVRQKALEIANQIVEPATDRLASPMAEPATAKTAAPVTKTPFDIPVYCQCWVIVQLDPGIARWQFAKNLEPCTSKTAADGHNFGLQHVYSTSHPQKPGVVENGVVTEDYCRVIYFGVAERAYPEDQFINLITEFKQDDPSDPNAERRMVVIFDPDVPNLGGSKIP